jgi:uncharacterized membrane protein YphA (DoxX/SURF4 family)
MKHSLGRYVYGLAAIASGICTLVWHDASSLQIKALGDASHHAILAYVAGAIQVLGGAAIALPRTARAGAAAVGTLYCIFALLGVPFIVAHPLVYNGFGNFFEQFSLASGAAILYAWSGPTGSMRVSGLARFGYYAFGICVVSFGLEQLFYLSATAGFVPKWIPPGQMFWAIVTTAAFFLAAVGLLTGYMAKLASRLNTAMIVGFGLLVWVPAIFADPHSFANWSEGTETLAIAATAWIVAEFLDYSESGATSEGGRRTK